MYSQDFDKLAHDALANIVKQAARDEWEYKTRELAEWPTGTAHDRDKFIDGLAYALNGLVMRVTGEDFDVAAGTRWAVL